MTKELTLYIANKCSLTVGTHIHAGHRPTTATDECDVVLIRGGGKTIYSVPGRVDQNVQVLSRAKSYPEAERRAYKIYDILIRVYGGVVMPNVDGLEAAMHCAVIEAINPPQYIGTDSQGRFEFSTNYIFRMTNQGA